MFSYILRHRRYGQQHMVKCLMMTILHLLDYYKCWAKFITPTGNFPAAYDPNRKLKNLTGHFPTSDNINRHMFKKKAHTKFFTFISQLHVETSNVAEKKSLCSLIVLFSFECTSKYSTPGHLANHFWIPWTQFDEKKLLL